jgi:L-alanine-DL-glutamate epimerase-like enolase superfamily enzyme
MNSMTSSRRNFLKGGAALGLAPFVPGSGGFAALNDVPMKIERVDTIPLRVPAGQFADGMIMTRPYLDYVFVKIHTDAGIVGMGEAPTDAVEKLETIKLRLDRYTAPKLIGQNPLEIARIHSRIRVRQSGKWMARHATAAINYALWDIMGKALNMPIHTLLGGLYRDKVLASVEVRRGTPEEMTRHSLEYYNQGFRGIKAKLGIDPDQDARSMKSIRETLGPDISIRADVNQGYTIQEAVRLCELAEEYDIGLELLEQPTSRTDWEGANRIMNAVNIPIEADEAADSLYQVYQLLRNDACDIINTKCSKAGGISGVMKWAAVAEAARKPIVIGTEYGLGNIVAAKVHLGCAIENADPVVEFTEMALHDLLLKTPLELKDGYIDVPTGPGLGVEFDEDKIAEYTVRDFPD